MINLTEDRLEKKKQFDQVLVEMQQSNAEILKQLEESANRRYEEEQQNESTTIVEPEKEHRSPTPFNAPQFDEEQESIQPSFIASSSSFSPFPSQHSTSSSPSIGSNQKEEIIDSTQTQMKNGAGDDNFISDQDSSDIEEVSSQQQSPSSLLQQQQSKSLDEQNSLSPLVIKQIRKKMENQGQKKKQNKSQRSKSVMKRTVSTNRSKSKKKLEPAIASARGSVRKATPFSALPRPSISELTFKQPSSLVPGQAEVSQHQYNTRSAQNRPITSSSEHQLDTNSEQQQQSSIPPTPQTFTASTSSSSSSSSADEMIKELLQKNAIIIPEQSKKGRKKKETGKPNKELLDLLHNSANVNPNEALKQLRTLKQDQRKSKMTGENETEKRKEREQQQENSIHRSISTLNGIEFASSNLALSFKDYGIQTQPSSSLTQLNNEANRHKQSQPPPSIGSDKVKLSDESSSDPLLDKDQIQKLNESGEN
ncbi:MAG: hypothetical protein EZS28_027055 [Streblomastix strix]|uniref:Uncharacterized protein n=1 Tax=Streblomastix strix TaxID=222440 RepID=A0A5J4V3U9_9EUKA|nr:MAG: hypothetical protein EZS28_027055 [Streblomastix strix]